MTKYAKFAYLRGEGLAVHPDDTEAELTAAQYLMQLQAYQRDYGDDVFKAYCSRLKILSYLTITLPNANDL